MLEVRPADKDGGVQQRSPPHKTAGSPNEEKQPPDRVDPSTENNPPNTDSKTEGVPEHETVQPSKGPGVAGRAGGLERSVVQQRDVAIEKRGEEESEPGKDREEGGGQVEASVHPMEMELDEKTAQDKSVEEERKEEEKEKEREEEEKEGEEEEKEKEEEEEGEGISLSSSDHRPLGDGYTVPMTRQETRSDSLGMEETQEEEEEEEEGKGVEEEVEEKEEIKEGEEEERVEEEEEEEEEETTNEVVEKGEEKREEEVEVREEQMKEEEEKKEESGWKQDSLAVGPDDTALEMERGQTGESDAPAAERENQDNEEKEEEYIKEEEEAEPLEGISVTKYSVL